MKSAIASVLMFVSYVAGSNHAPCQNVNRGYNKPACSNRPYYSRGHFELWVNPITWRISSRKSIKDAEFQLDLISGDGHAVVMTEKKSMPMASLNSLAVENARKAARDVRVVAEEQRIVNGREIASLTIESTVKGTPVTRYGYFYSGKEGTIQVITLIAQNLFEKNREDFTGLLNGLMVLEKPRCQPTAKTARVDPLDMPQKDDFLVPTDLPASVPEPASAGRGFGVSARSASHQSGNSGSTGVVTTVDERPIPLNKPRPNFTEEARKNKVSGIVVARLLVGADGMVKKVLIECGLPDGLDEEAIRAAYEIRFKPAMKDNKPVAYNVRVEIEFWIC